MGKDIHIGIDGLSKLLINLLTQRLVSVKELRALQELHTIRKKTDDFLATAIYIYLINTLDLYKSIKDITEQGLITQHFQILTCYSFAVQTNGNKCNCFHIMLLLKLYYTEGINDT